MTAPPLHSDYFTFLGLPPKLKIDSSQLQKRFYELSRQLHPDRFGNASPSEQQYALDATALLNAAYRTLRDPVLRTEYLLKQNGLDIESSSAPPELLEEVFEFNMALEEVETSRPELEQAREKFTALLTDADIELNQQADRYDEGQPDALQSLRGILNRRKYIQNLVRDVNKALE